MDLLANLNLSLLKTCEPTFAAKQVPFNLIGGRFFTNGALVAQLTC